MQDQRPPLQPGEPVPAFTLPAANREGTVSLADLRGRPFLIGFYRGLHCPFCRHQVVQLASLQPALHEAGVDLVAVINTPLDRARMYFRHRPTPVMLLSDPDCGTHRAFGVPHIEFVPDDAREKTQWPYSPPWRNSWRHATTRKACTRRRCSRWKATSCSMPRMVSRCRKPTTPFLRPMEPSSPVTSW
jgi:peroxiredoxin